MGCDGGLAFVAVRPKVTLDEAYKHLNPFFKFDAKGCDWGDDSRSEWLRENDAGHTIVVPYGTDIWDEYLMADEVNEFISFLEMILKKNNHQDLTFGDVLIERDTSPTWDPPDPGDKRFYQAIEESDMLDEDVATWIAKTEKILTGHVYLCETWT